MPYQTWRSSPGCTGGGKEAEELFQLALNYEKGINGMPYDAQKAMKLYEESMKMGNPKAALNLGLLCRTAFGTQYSTEEIRFKYMNALFNHAILMGCPDGYYALAISYYRGYGVQEDIKKGDEYMKKGAEEESLSAMYGYGVVMKKDGRVEEAKTWWHKALDGGFGLAGFKLYVTYWYEKNYKMMIDVLRRGARLGDVKCIFALGGIYGDGKYGQPRDEEYGERLFELYDSIEQEGPPPMLENFDELFPPKEVVPYRANQH